MKPLLSDHPEFYVRYISLVTNDSVTEAMLHTKKEVERLMNRLNEDLGNYAYANGKWTIKEVLLHCIDTERIFSTRALSFARGESQKALSFDEDTYAANSHANTRTLQNIMQEFESVNAATFNLFSSFAEQVLQTVGETPSGSATVNAVGFAICGHSLHHMGVIRERYLKDLK